MISWLRAAPEIVRGEVLGAFVAHDGRVEVQTAALRAEKAEAELAAAHEALDVIVERHPNGNVLEPPMTLTARIEAYREWARRLVVTLEDRTAERDAARIEVARLVPTSEDRTALRTTIRKALDLAWHRGFSKAREYSAAALVIRPDRFDPGASYGTDDLLPTEFW